MSPKTS